jgi:hypothetical protein
MRSIRLAIIGFHFVTAGLYSVSSSWSLFSPYEIFADGLRGFGVADRSSRPKAAPASFATMSRSGGLAHPCIFHF